MARVREVDIDHDDVGRPYVERERVVRRGIVGGGVGWGMLAALVLIIAAFIAFAYYGGSFEQLGADADRATANINQQVDETAGATGDALEDAGERADRALN
jgi:hypothetical protein